jgi:hypothetical protein
MFTEEIFEDDIYSFVIIQNTTIGNCLLKD